MALMRETTQLLNELPKDRRSWQYNNKAILPYQERIDRITSSIIQQNNSSSFEELSQLLDVQTDFYLRVYGEQSPEGNEGKLYKENKLKELNGLMGNALLRDLSSLIGREEWKKTNQFTAAQLDEFYQERRGHYLTKKNLTKLKSSVQESHQDFLNRLSFERDEHQKELQRKYELEHGRS